MGWERAIGPFLPQFLQIHSIQKRKCRVRSTFTVAISFPWVPLARPSVSRKLTYIFATPNMESALREIQSEPWHTTRNRPSKFAGRVPPKRTHSRDAFNIEQTDS